MSIVYDLLRFHSFFQDIIKEEDCPTAYAKFVFVIFLYKDGVFEVLQSLRENENFCDIKLETDDGKIVFRHKLIFISASPYFHAMFTSFEETNKDHVNIKELDSKVLQLLVDYMYTGEITVTKENVQVMLPAADLLQLDYVKQACVLFLQKQLDPSNCLGIKAYADVYNCKELLLSSEEFIKKQFIEVVKYDEFLSLSLEEVIKLISCDDISIPFEEKAYECVINWVKHELNCRKDSLSNLMEHVRLPLISKEYILEKVVDEPLLISCPKCKDYVFEALHFYLIKSVHPYSIPQTMRNKPRLCSPQKIVLVLSLSDSRYNKLIPIWYDPATDLLYIAPKFSKLLGACGLGVLNDQFVFAVGGVRNFKYSQAAEILDVSSQAQCWVPTVHLLVDRIDFGVGALHNCIYAIGGISNVQYSHGYSLNSVEVFNFSTQQWQMVSSMASKRSNCGVGILNNLLFAVGGKDSISCLKSVECYNPSIDKWNPVAEMSLSRYNVSVGVLDGIMYAIGGVHKSVVQKTVEAYNPSTGVWKSIPDMHLSRQNAGVFTLNGLLYVMGGNADNINSIEMYSPKTNSWSMKTSGFKGTILGAVVVNKPSDLRPQ